MQTFRTRKGPLPTVAQIGLSLGSVGTGGIEFLLDLPRCHGPVDTQSLAQSIGESWKSFFDAAENGTIIVIKLPDCYIGKQMRPLG